MPAPSTVSVSARDWKEETYSLFFYGTLLHPAVLKRVIGHEGSGLYHQPAILFDYTRHHVKGDDYPAIVSWDQAKNLYTNPDGSQTGFEPAPSDRNVRGSLVTGFTAVDVELLDVFEGDEYERDQVSVVPLGPSQPLSVVAADDGIVFDTVTQPTEQQIKEQSKFAHVYVWTRPLETLDPGIWSYGTFIRDNVHKWVGGEVARFSYLDVEERQKNMKMEKITREQKLAPEIPVVEDDSAGMTNASSGSEEYKFGHGMLKYFCFDPGFINLNHGSFGSCPKPVMEACQAITYKMEARCDLFHRFELVEALTGVRTRLANLCKADVDDVVLIPNAMHGVNIVLHNFEWKADDILIGFSTTYGAVSKTLLRYAESPPYPTVHTIPLIFPTTPASILSLFRSQLQTIQAQRKEGSQVVAVIDGIISVPGAILPWEEMVQICKEYNVFSLVDGAHTIGQIDLDLKSADPDFFITNCHKWMYAKRPCAALYVPKRNHNRMRHTFPISSTYIPRSEEFKLDELYEWTGTYDYAPFLSVNAALDFREQIGGEKRIHEYCHALAREGGARMAAILGTELIDENDEFTASMVDVRLPLPESEVKRYGPSIGVLVMEKLLKEWHCMAAIYVHDGKLYARASAQVFSELGDFEYVAKALTSVCQDFAEAKELPTTIVKDGTIRPTK